MATSGYRMETLGSDNEALTSMMGDITNMTTAAPPTPARYPGLVKLNQDYGQYHGYIAAAVCVFGVMSNMANIVVLTRKNMISSTNLILTWLAVADLLTMVTYLPVSIHFYILREPELMFPASRSIHWIRFMLFHVNSSVTFHTVAIWLTIVLALFRFLYICYPTRGAQLCCLQRAKMAIIAVYVSVMVVCVPNYLTTTIKESRKQDSTCILSIEPISVHSNVTEKEEGANNCSSMFYEFESTHIAKLGLQNVNYWVQAGLFKLVPCIILSVLTLLLIIAMHKANKRRMKLKSQGRKAESDRARETNRTTAMLLAVVALFLVTELPQGILTLCSIFVKGFFMDVYWQLGDVLDIMALLNNSINFVLYCSMSAQFRNTFTDIFCGFCPKKRPGFLKLSTFSSDKTTATNV